MARLLVRKVAFVTYECNTLRFPSAKKFRSFGGFVPTEDFGSSAIPRPFRHNPNSMALARRTPAQKKARSPSTVARKDREKRRRVVDDQDDSNIQSLVPVDTRTAATTVISKGPAAPNLLKAVKTGCMHFGVPCAHMVDGGVRAMGCSLLVNGGCEHGGNNNTMAIVVRSGCVIVERVEFPAPVRGFVTHTLIRSGSTHAETGKPAEIYGVVVQDMLVVGLASDLRLAPGCASRSAFGTFLALVDDVTKPSRLLNSVVANGEGVCVSLRPGVANAEMCPSFAIVAGKRTRVSIQGVLATGQLGLFVSERAAVTIDTLIAKSCIAKLGDGCTAGIDHGVVGEMVVVSTGGGKLARGMGFSSARFIGTSPDATLSIVDRNVVTNGVRAPVADFQPCGTTPRELLLQVCGSTTAAEFLRNTKDASAVRGWMSLVVDEFLAQPIKDAQVQAEKTLAVGDVAAKAVVLAISRGISQPFGEAMLAAKTLGSIRPDGTFVLVSTREC